MSILDVFNQDSFSTLTLTDAINKEPFVPGRVGQLVGWEETSSPTTNIGIESKGGSIKLIDPSPRGGPGETSDKQKREMRLLSVPHYQHDDAILADEVQNVRRFGSENMLQNLTTLVNDRAREHARLKLDPTLEYQRLGAVKGIILNGSGSTHLNLFDFLGEPQAAEVNFALNTAANGALRKNVTKVLRTIANNLGGATVRGVHALCGDEFWDELVKNAEVRESYVGQPEASRLRDSVLYTTVDFGGITWENYRGSIGATPFIESTKCHIFPVGSPGLFRTAFAPADYIDTVNLPGLPRYSKQRRMANEKGIHLEAQMNAINYCTRPGALIKGKMAA